MIRLVVYGSLRQGMYNHSTYMHDAVYKGTERLKGWDMYSYGVYPYVAKGDGSVVVEVYELPDKDAKRIADMETGAGYHLVVVETAHGKAGMFVKYQPARVIDGDWVSYVNERNTQ